MCTLRTLNTPRHLKITYSRPNRPLLWHNCKLEKSYIDTHTHINYSSHKHIQFDTDFLDWLTDWGTYEMSGQVVCAGVNTSLNKWINEWTGEWMRGCIIHLKLTHVFIRLFKRVDYKSPTCGSVFSHICRVKWFINHNKWLNIINLLLTLML